MNYFLCYLKFEEGHISHTYLKLSIYIIYKLKYKIKLNLFNLNYIKLNI